MKKANLVWLLAIVGLIVYDIAMVSCNQVPGDTLSEGIWAMDFDSKSIFLGLAIGVVLGHLFWQKDEK